ncbi:MAG: hypothetical protein QW184_01400 [Nanopusillaceae archaeon]
MAYNKRYADWSRKIWLEVYAPQKVFRNVLLGETLVNREEEQKAINRTVDLNLAFLTGNFKYQNYKAIFKIVSFSGEKYYTELKELALYEAYVRRIVRKGTSKVDESFVVKTLDGVDVRIKPLIITKHKANRRQKASIRKICKEFLQNKVQSLEFYDLINKIMNYEIQDELKPILNKIFPVDKVEIRRLVRIEKLKKS